MKRPVKIALSVISVAAAAVCVFCILYLVQYFRGNTLNDRLRKDVVRTASPEPLFSSADSQTETSAPETPGKAFSTVDFDALRKINDDIYAWIEIPGTNVSYPVAQNADDDLFYLRRGVDKTYYSSGTIFSQRYNTTTLEDPMTVLYGHTNKIGTMFTELNNFADAIFFDENRYIYIYTPGEVYEYTIFAAYPHSNDHLLLCNDFSNPQQFDAYFAGLTDAINSNYRRELFPSSGDKVLTLSTCYLNNDLQRFLVQGVLTARYPIDPIEK